MYLIDTPGFNDTFRSDTENLKDIAFFLSQTYTYGIRTTGVIFLHRIIDVRLGGSSLRTLKLLKKICGEKAYGNFALVTTMWDALETTHAAIGERREAELISTQDWWGDMYERNSKIFRHSAGDHKCANRIVDCLVDLRTTIVLALQSKTVDHQIPLLETAAGQELSSELSEFRRQHEVQIAQLQAEYSKALRNRDLELADAALEHRRHMQRKVAEAKHCQKMLEVSLERLSAEQTAEYEALLTRTQAERARLQTTLESAERELRQARMDRQRDEAEYKRVQKEYETTRSRLQQRIDHLDFQVRVSATRDLLNNGGVHLPGLSQQPFYSSHASEQVEVQRAVDRIDQEHETRMVQQSRQETSFTAKENKANNKVRSAKSRLKAYGTMGLPLIGVLAGVAVTAAGAAHMNPVMVAGGIALASAAAARFKKPS